MSTQTGGGGIRAVERAFLAPKGAAGPASRPAWRFRVSPTAGAVATAATVAGGVGLVAAVGTAVARAYGTHGGSGPIDAPAFPRVLIRREVGSCSEREGATVAVLKTPRDGAHDAHLLRRSLKRPAVDPEGGTRGNFVGVLRDLTKEYVTVLKTAMDAASGDDAHSTKTGGVHLVIHPLLTLSYGYGAELDARAFYAAVAALPIADSRRLTSEVCMLNKLDDSGFDRYERAFAAARRVCEYRRPTPPRRSAINAIASLVSQPPPELVSHSRGPARTPCAVANTRTEAAVHLCASKSSGVLAGIMVAADGSCQARGLVKSGVETPRNGHGVYFSVDASAVMREDHATQEDTVVSAWLRGECETGDGGPADREARMNELFLATIAYRWGVESSGSSATDTIPMVDYTTTTSAADFGDAWVVRDAKLRRAGTDATAHLVFVIGPNASGAKKERKDIEAGRKSLFVECVRVSVRAGLDAMIREGVRLALVTRVPCAEDEGVYATSDAEFVALVNELLQEKVAYVDDGPTGQSEGRAVSGRAERGCYFDAVLVPLGGLRPPRENAGSLRFGGMRVGPPHRFV